MQPTLKGRIFLLNTRRQESVVTVLQTAKQSHILLYSYKLFIIFLLFCYVFLGFSVPEGHNAGHHVHSLLLSSELLWENLSESFCLRCLEILNGTS